MGLRASSAALAATVGMVAGAAHAGEPPGRYASISLGATSMPSLGHATAAPPALLQTAPELQLAWGLRLGRGGLLYTRFDLLGAMVPVGPTGVGLDIGAGWSSALDGGYGAIFRLSAGGLLLASGGDALGPDYTAYGFRLSAEAGVLHASGAFTWQILLGLHATGLPHVEPCNPGDDCSDASIGPTLRAEAGWMF